MPAKLRAVYSESAQSLNPRSVSLRGVTYFASTVSPRKRSFQQNHFSLSSVYQEPRWVGFIYLHKLPSYFKEHSQRRNGNAKI